MPDLQELHKKIVDLVYDKFSRGTINWTPRDSEDSFQTNISAYNIHLDRRRVGSKDSYIVWIFGEDGFNDRIDAAELTGIPPGDHPYTTYRGVIAEMFDKIENGSRYKALEDLIGKLES